ncbi:MAG: YqaE/Pmp3 family membrane protein [bacterium]
MLDYNSLDDNKRKKNIEGEKIGGSILYFLWGLVQGLFLLLIAFILPPLAVVLKCNFKQFAISVVLTLFGWIPGIIYALAVIKIDFKKK